MEISACRGLKLRDTMVATRFSRTVSTSRGDLLHRSRNAMPSCRSFGGNGLPFLITEVLKYQYPLHKSSLDLGCIRVRRASVDISPYHKGYRGLASALEIIPR
jgi:hypothetical protein